jgi:hypothetical protein
MERTHIHSHWKILKSCHPPSTKKLKFTLAAGIQIHYRGTIGGLSINQTNNYFDQRKLPQMSFLVIADFCFDEFWPVPRNDRYYLDFRSVEFFFTATCYLAKRSAVIKNSSRFLQATNSAQIARLTFLRCSKDITKFQI